MRRVGVVTAAAVLAAATAAGCASDAGGSGGALRVVAGFYPLAFVAERVGGDRVTVQTAIKPGVEPHDVELSPSETARVEQADLVLVLRGFQPALDDAVRGRAARSVLDAAAALDLAGKHTDEHADEPAGEHEDEHADEHEGGDPHFWLDPTLVQEYADAVATRLGELDGAGAGAYTAAAAGFKRELASLHDELRAGLAGCARRELVTSHAAFGYLADRYGLTETGIAGLSPEAEPSPRRIREVAAYVREHGVTTIYFETLVSPDVARTIAGETGARTAVLDPVEAITTSGDTYFTVMRRNLAALRAGLGCP